MGFLDWFRAEPELEENEVARCIEHIEQLQKQLDGFWQEWSALEAEISKFNTIVNFYTAVQAVSEIEQEYLPMKTVKGMLKNIAKSLESTKKTLLDRRSKLYQKYCDSWSELEKTHAYLYSLI